MNKNPLITYLRDNNNQFVVGVDKDKAAAFNRYIKGSFFKLYCVAQCIANTVTKTRHHGYTYVETAAVEGYCVSMGDPYSKSPTPAQLLADIALALSNRYPELIH